MIQNIKKTWYYFKRNGLAAAVAKASEQISQQSSERGYQVWLAKHLPTPEQLKIQRQYKFTNPITFSIIVPTYRTNPVFLRQMVDSVLDQTYPYLELCIADGSPDDSVSDILKEYRDSRIRYQRLAENKGISGNTNAAFAMAKGDYIALLDHDDILTPDALYEMAAAVETDPTIDMLYSDEDKVSADLKQYFNPHFKPDFNPELLRTNNYICHFLVVKKDLAACAGHFRPEYDGAQDYDFIFRCSEQARRIYHIPKILYHWRSHIDSTAANPQSKLYAYEAGKRALESHLQRMQKQNNSGKPSDQNKSKDINLKTEVSHTSHLGFYRVQYIPLSGSHTEQCYMHICDAKSLKPQLRTEIQQELTANCMRPEVGIVGGKTLYPDGRVLQAGLRRTEEGTYEPEFQGLKKRYSGYMHRADLQRCADSVSFDCFAVKRELLEQLGISPQDLKTQEDINRLCGKIKAAGYLVIFTPYACIRMKHSGMIHDEMEHI